MKLKLIIATILAVVFVSGNNLNAGVWDDIKSKASEVKDKTTDLLKSDDNRALNKMDKIQDFSGKYIEARENEKSAPIKHILKKTKDDYQADAEKIVSEVEAILFDGEIVGYAEKIRQNRDKIKKIKDNIASLKELRVSAKADKNENKAKEIDEKIVKLSEEIKDIEISIAVIEDKISHKFELLGVSMTREQIDTLCIRIDGDDIIKSVTMYEILKEILAHTQKLMVANSENMEYVKKYYGVYVLLTETIVYAQSKYIKNNKEVWTAKLNELKVQASSVIKKTKDSMSQITDNRRKSILENNIQSNLFTIQVIDLYNKELARQREKVEQAKKQAMQDVIVAWSSYETASVSAELVSTIDQADKAFESIIRMEVPEIIVFENSAVKTKFSELTTRLSAK